MRLLSEDRRPHDSRQAGQQEWSIVRPASQANGYSTYSYSNTVGSSIDTGKILCKGVEYIAVT